MYVFNILNLLLCWRLTKDSTLHLWSSGSSRDEGQRSLNNEELMSFLAASSGNGKYSLKTRRGSTPVIELCSYEELKGQLVCLIYLPVISSCLLETHVGHFMYHFMYLKTHVYVLV